jgi:hypothetical protein
MTSNLIVLQADRSLSSTYQNITGLFLGCQVNAELWVPVKKMIWVNGKYRTGYVGGVKDLIAAGSVWRHYFRPQDFDRVKVTRDIHCDYAPRMPLDRPQEMLHNLPLLGLSADLSDPIAYVARSGGYRETDDLDVFPEIAADPDGCYRFHFLLRKLHAIESAVIDAVAIGDKIVTQDWNAIHQSTGQQIGIVPGYIRALIAQYSPYINLKIEKINQVSRLQQRLLCSATCQGFTPFTTSKYLPLENLG